MRIPTEFLSGMALTDGKPDYEAVRTLFETSLPQEAPLYNEFHALIVNVGKNWCRPRDPRCGKCPLGTHLPADSPLRVSAPTSSSLAVERCQ